MRRCVLVLAVSLLAATPLTASAADWPTFHGDNTRQGNDSTDPRLANPAPGWSSVQLDGAIYGQPVVVGGQVIVATENNTVYSLSAADGSVQWFRHLGTPRTHNFPCGNIDPLGITGTPVIDHGAVFVSAEIELNPTSFFFELASINLSNGQPFWTTNIDPPDSRFDPNVEQQRGALMVAANRVFVPLGGLDGDCGNYHGYVLSYPETPPAPLQWWASTEVDSSNREGGAWAAGGMSQDTTGYVYVATGNSNHISAGDAYDYSDGVMKFDPTSVPSGAPLDYFAPTTWTQDNAGDVDLGSTTPLQLPNNHIFIVGKSGNGYLLNNANLGHIGGQLATHRVCSATNSAVFGSLAYANGVVYVGCNNGLTAVGINGTSTDFAVNWHNGTDVVDHPPTVAGGLIWAVTPNNATLLAFNLSGQRVQSFSIGTSTHFTTPAAASGQLYVASGAVVHEFSSAPLCTSAPLIGDVNHDARADLLSTSGAGACVMPSTGSAFLGPALWSSSAFYGTRATLAGDVNGDGRSDAIAVDDGATWVMLSTGSGFSGPGVWSGVNFWGTRATLAADVNGDGRADLVAVDDTATWVMLSTPSGFSAPQLWSGVPFYGSKATFTADVNGDGRADLVAVGDNATWVMLSTGSGFSAPQPWSGTPFFGSRATLAGDVNGDGRADLMAVGDNATWVMLSTGSGFSAPQPWSGTPFFGALATLAGDVNGDRRADLVAVSPGGTWVMTSTGSGFSAPALWSTGSI
jgi:FG-GAP-like repeat/PQQ-like domain